MSYGTYFRELEVMAVDKDGMVHIADRNNDKIILVKRKDWIRIQNEYLDQKAEYFKRYEYYCGSEFITYEGDTTGTTKLLDYDTMEYVDTPIVSVSLVEIEMEHG